MEAQLSIEPLTLQQVVPLCLPFLRGGQGNQVADQPETPELGCGSGVLLVCEGGGWTLHNDFPTLVSARTLPSGQGKPPPSR